MSLFVLYGILSLGGKENAASGSFSLCGINRYLVSPCSNSLEEKITKC